MSYNVTVPNAGQSPGLFPAQANTNFNRLQQIINNEHVFNNTLNIDTDGVHRQVTLIDRAKPASVPAGTNGVLYAKTVSATSQLFYFNGVVDTQITPNNGTLYPLTIVGSATVPSGGTVTAYADPGFEYNGIGTVNIQSTNIFGQYTIVRSGANFKGTIDDNGTASPQFLFSGNNLQVKNTQLSPKILVWSLMLNRIS
jgi:hypothetical protein